ncbi:N-acetylmuramoyl-L-alanine amidase [Mesobacillus campisalis]|uniref:N-acetylmuramoyl-L-alanine amidase n=1 Tax=Mesobacillus campisalis TaxID=1408103 RepID=UPI00069C70D1|nr:N-acetylmuramoyl-L-alanine amidase [Mesobacillus campisalis]
MKAASFVSRIICFLVIFTLFVSIDGHRAEAAYTYQGKVNVDSLNVRSNAGTSYAIIGKLKKDQVVTVYENRQGWSKIAFGQKYGWVSSQFLINVTWTGYVTGTNLNVRKSPSATAGILTQLGKGTAVTVQGKDGSWLKVYIPSKKVTGWVHGDYISNNPAAPAPTVTTAATKVATTQVVLLENSNFRKGPGTNYGSISIEKAGTLLTKIGESNGWIQAKRADGVTGWVAGWLVGAAPSSPLKGKTIVIDPGHGGVDGGASGRLYVEKRLTLNAAVELGSLLQKAGAKVIYTRSSDLYVSLNQRVAISNQSNAHAFISIHYNSCSGVCSGIETFYYNMAKDSAMARSIQSNLVKSTQLRDRGTKYGTYQVIRNNQRPAALVELGFLSNPTEESLIGTSAHQKKAAQGIYNGLAAFFK